MNEEEEKMEDIRDTYKELKLVNNGDGTKYCNYIRDTYKELKLVS